jgi:hypothetical protein
MAAHGSESQDQKAGTALSMPRRVTRIEDLLRLADVPKAYAQALKDAGATEDLLGRCSGVELDELAKGAGLNSCLRLRLCHAWSGSSEPRMTCVQQCDPSLRHRC